MLQLIYSILKDLASGGQKMLVRKLTHEEQDILAHCAERGEIWQIHVDMFGDWVRSGKMDFFNQQDLGYNAIYNEALDRLCSRGLVKHEGGLLFRLTGTGFRIARSLSRPKMESNEESSNQHAHRTQ